MSEVIPGRIYKEHFAENPYWIPWRLFWGILGRYSDRNFGDLFEGNLDRNLHYYQEEKEIPEETLEDFLTKSF